MGEKPSQEQQRPTIGAGTSCLSEGEVSRTPGEVYFGMVVIVCRETWQQGRTSPVSRSIPGASAFFFFY